MADNTPLAHLTPASVNIPLAFMQRRAQELARDIVVGLDSAANLAKDAGLNEHQWDFLKTWPAFRSMVSTAKQELSGSMGVTERIRRKAALALDAVGILDLATIAGDPKTIASTRIDAIETLMNAAQVGGKAQQANAQFGPLVVINWGDTAVPVGAVLEHGQ